jgi:hypothetical protein
VAVTVSSTDAAGNTATTRDTLDGGAAHGDADGIEGGDNTINGRGGSCM